MRFSTDHTPASRPDPDWRAVALGMLVLAAYLSLSSAGLTMLARVLDASH